MSEKPSPAKSVVPTTVSVLAVLATLLLGLGWLAFVTAIFGAKPPTSWELLTPTWPAIAGGGLAVIAMLLLVRGRVVQSLFPALASLATMILGAWVILG